MKIKYYFKTFLTPYPSRYDFYQDLIHLIAPIRIIAHMLALIVVLPFWLGVAFFLKNERKNIIAAIPGTAIVLASKAIKEMFFFPSAPFRLLVRALLTPLVDSPKIEYKAKMQDLKREGKKAIENGDIDKAKSIKSTLSSKFCEYYYRGESTDIRTLQTFYYNNDANIGNYFTLFSKKPNKLEILQANFQDKEVIMQSEHQKWRDDLQAKVAH